MVEGERRGDDGVERRGENGRGKVRRERWWRKRGKGKMVEGERTVTSRAID